MGDILDQTIMELENEKDKTLHLLERGLQLTKMVDKTLFLQFRDMVLVIEKTV